AGPVGGHDETRVGVWAVEVFEHVPAEGGAEADVVDRTVLGGDGEGVGRLAGHAELAAGQLLRHVLAGLAGVGQLEVVDGGRAVHRHRGNDATLDPVDQERGAAG